ncbi:phosphoserine phosphatase SerB [Kineosporiaceae bacterium SCSIO 59966]|nr:phosphoserine phosphatase SerB [Kineosporiaceae bacterium SCSIO 59966]
MSTLLVTVTGPDRPGAVARLLEVAARPGAEILDVEQAVVRGRLSLAVRLRTGTDGQPSAEALTALGRELGLHVTCEAATGEQVPEPLTRLHVAVLGSPLGAGALADVVRRLADHGGTVQRVRRLASEPVTCVELDVSGEVDLLTVRRDLAVRAASLGIDVAVSPAGLERRGRRLVVLDVDSTLIREEVVELLAAHAGRAAEVAAVTERAMRGELDFAASLHQRVACLAGLDAAVLDAVRRAVRLTAGARTLVDTLHRLGFPVGLVSGGFAEVVEPLAADLGVRHVRANRLEVRGGRLTGRVTGPVVDRAAKAAALREMAAAEGVPMSSTVAVGDGANDLDMLTAAGLGVAFCAKPLVREQADAVLSHPYLDTVLHLLGIPRDDFAPHPHPDPLS